MRLFVTGGTGLIGRRLVLDRLDRSDTVAVVSRDPARARTVLSGGSQHSDSLTIIRGNPALAGEWQRAVAGCDAVVHLAGAGIADRRWTAGYKKRIVSSRVDSTRLIVDAIEGTQPSQRPSTFISGSATGYYGDGGDRELNESSPPGTDFLAQLTVNWEAQALRAEVTSANAVRVVLLRSGAVLDDRGGALVKMALPFRLFAGGRIGSGQQFMPWIHWRDVVGLIDFALTDSRVRGPLNGVAPQAVRNSEFAAALGRVLGRPSWIPAPAFALRVAMGEVARYLAASQRVVPAKALKLGYEFVHPILEPALESLLKRRD
jgi:uncharacterized protein (TIGR01777 family)